jgi:hypothetical protein
MLGFSTCSTKKSCAFSNGNSKSFAVNLNARGVIVKFDDRWVAFAIDCRRIYKNKLFRNLS